MAQHDYDIANQSGANFRADLNNALDAIVSNNSGSSEPSTTFAYEWWIDTSANVLKLRNSANNAWITLPLSITADNSTSGGLTVNGNLATTGTVDINGQELILDADADTSITADTDDQIDFRVGAVDVMTLTNSHLVLKGTTPKITIGDGGAEDTALIFDGNAQDFYIGLDDTDDFLKIGTGSTIGTNTLVTIENGGNVGIGCDPVGTLQIRTQANANATFQNSTSVSGGVKINCFNDAGNASSPFEIDGSSLQFNIASTEKMRLDSSGNLGIGTTAPDELLTVLGNTSSALDIGSDNSAEVVAQFLPDSTNSRNGRLKIAGTSTPLNNSVALISDASTNVGMCFVTTGGGTKGERLVINSDGAVLIGKTVTGFSTAGIEFRQNGGADFTRDDGNVININRKSSNGTIVEFYKDQSSVGSISTNSNSLPSDKNFKRDITDLDLGLDLVKKLQPSQYNYKLDDEDCPKMYGLIAQDLEESLTEVGVEKNSTWLLQHNPKDDENQSEYSLDYTKLIPILVNSIKELELRVKTLEG